MAPVKSDRFASNLESHSAEARTYANLQALRALAAVAVVVFHFGLLPTVGLPFPVGAAGVDLFFVLSGFVIAYSASRSAAHFLLHRLARVLPAYWIATLIAALFAFPNILAAELWDWLTQSLLLLPGPGGRPALIFVAWTLIYELAFYLLYWGMLRLHAAAAPYLAIGALTALGIVPLPTGHGPWPLLLEFAIGVGIYLAMRRMGQVSRLGRRLGLFLAVIGLALMPVMPMLTDYQPADHESVSRVVTWGLPSMLLLPGALLMERGGWAITSRPLLTVGAASYALYLLHPVAVGQLFALPANSAPTGLLVCLIATLGSILVAVAFHLIIERPLYHRLRRATSI